MSKVVSVLVVLAAVIICGAWFIVVPDGDITGRFEDAPPAASPGTVRITRAVPTTNNGSSAATSTVQRTVPDVVGSSATTELVQQAASTVAAEQTTIARLTGANLVAIQATPPISLVETLPISGTIQQSNAVQLVDWQAGADTTGHFAFTGQVAHSPLAGAVYSTAVVHLYNSNNRLIAMLPVEDFPRRIYSNVPRTFTLQTDIDATDVDRYAFYINVTRVEQVASEGSELCPDTRQKTASMRCAPPTF